MGEPLPFKELPLRGGLAGLRPRSVLFCPRPSVFPSSFLLLPSVEVLWNRMGPDSKGAPLGDEGL